MASEDLSIGLLVLHHLRIDTLTLFNDNIASLHCTDCSLEGTDTVKAGKQGRVMFTRLNNLPNDDPNIAQMAITKSQKVNY